MLRRCRQAGTLAGVRARLYSAVPSMAYYRKLLTIIFERRRRLAERVQQRYRRGNRQGGNPTVPLSHEGRGQVVSEASGRVVQVSVIVASSPWKKNNARFWRRRTDGWVKRVTSRCPDGCHPSGQNCIRGTCKRVARLLSTRLYIPKAVLTILRTPTKSGRVGSFRRASRPV